MLSFQTKLVSVFRQRADFGTGGAFVCAIMCIVVHGAIGCNARCYY